MAYLELKNIHKSFEGRKVLDAIDLSIELSSFTSLLGESGCGKTTLLRIIAGLERADAGSILLNGKDITHLSPQERNIGVVFQNYALFPHMTVFENIAFGLKIKKMAASDIRNKVNAVLEKVNLVARTRDAVTALSGGEQQRVALARALVMEPQLLLLDEPLSNLDHSLRIQARNELKRLQYDTGLTSVFVTHDQSEALALSDRVAVMKQGSMVQFGRPQEIYLEPASLFVAEFVGRYNVFTAEQSRDWLSHTIPTGTSALVLPEHLGLQKSEKDSPLKVKDILFTGVLTEYLLSHGDQSFKSIRLTGASLDLKTGDGVQLLVSPEHIRTLS